MRARIPSVWWATWAVVAWCGAPPTPSHAQDWQPPPAPDEQQQQQQQQQQPSGQGSGGAAGQPSGKQSKQPAWYTDQDTEKPPGVSSGASAAASAPEKPADTDHGAVVGALGIGFYGVENLPLDPGIPAAASGVAPPTGGDGSVVAPALGVRYWPGDTLGLDVVLAVGYRTFDKKAGGMLTGGGDGVGFNMQVGTPIALGAWEHLTLLAIPEIDFGYATGTRFAMNPQNDVNLKSFRFQLNARLGAEIQFGFMDIPQLSLQVTTGLGFEFLKEEASNPNVTLTNSGYQITTPFSDDILGGTIQLLYYFN